MYLNQAILKEIEINCELKVEDFELSNDHVVMIKMILQYVDIMVGH